MFKGHHRSRRPRSTMDRNMKHPDITSTSIQIKCGSLDGRLPPLRCLTCLLRVTHAMVPRVTTDYFCYCGGYLTHSLTRTGKEMTRKMSYFEMPILLNVKRMNAIIKNVETSCLACIYLQQHDNTQSICPFSVNMEHFRPPKKRTATQTITFEDRRMVVSRLR
jgi:hypothetical protein